MNPHFYAELSRVSNEELDRAAVGYRRSFGAQRRPVAPSTVTRTERPRFSFARLRPATR